MEADSGETVKYATVNYTKKDTITWSKNTKYAEEVNRARSIYGDGPFSIKAIVPGDFDPKHNWYVELIDQKGSIVKHINREGNALFETYLFERLC